MKLYLRKTLNSLSPADDESAEMLKSLKLGDVVSAEIRRSRNYPFLRKWFALVKIMFEQKSEYFGDLEHNGVKVQPSFDRFRKDVIIRTGRYTPVFDSDGCVYLEADSISFAKMKAEEFEKLFSDTVQVALDLLQGYSEQDLRYMVDEVLRFA